MHTEKTRNRTLSQRVALVTSIVTLALLLGACGGPPTEALDEAEKSLLNAAWAEDCAQDTYRSARKMLDEAKLDSEEGRYEEAERKAKAAVRLAEQARTDAELGAEECERRKQALNAIEDKLGDEPVTVVTQAPEDALRTVYFDFDQALLSIEAQAELDKNGAYLMKHQDVRVRIEGHTDDRGSTEYNIALSQRRAQAAKRYLQAIGVDETRMKVVPFGEERPASYGGGEGDHARNRRAEFVPF